MRSSAEKEDASVVALAFNEALETHREELRGSSRQPREEACGPLAPEPLADGSDVVCLFGKANDVGAWIVRAAPDQPMSMPDTGVSGGRFLLLADGDVTLEKIDQEDVWCVFVEPDEPPPALVAGASGAAMLVLQFRPLLIG